MQSDRVVSIIEKQRAAFNSGRTRSIAYRQEQLRKLYSCLQQAEPDIMEAISRDFYKPAHDTYMTEIGVLLTEIRHAIKHLPRWAKPERVPTTPLLLGSSSSMMYEPYGVTLIIAPWNYPLQLALSPLVGALAAGNCAVLKPSELTPHTSALLARLCKDTFAEDEVAVVEGGVEVSTELLEQPFDFIFFTGSTAVGKIVAAAAARQLTPVVLELGGKSPTIVHADAQIELAAKRIVWGKFMNAGQTCVAPDYVLVHDSVREAFVQAMRASIEELYGDVLQDRARYTSIVNERHFNRLTRLLEGATPLIGGRVDEERRLIEPTVLADIQWDSKIMEDEIFGPILPLMSYESLNEVIAPIVARPKPLAMYVFSESREVQQRLLDSISFGGGCINDTIMHLSSPYLPFGGVGASGVGAYHGCYSFKAFSHTKSVLKQTTAFDLPFRYGTMKHSMRWMKRFFK
ncbi:aldehyde dehydrogenase [Paenibacillus sp. YYML68]|uniref:aldehyde dehydrogenase n=1 Tax=Paenibacillus sp. YYML68 TaxID=2909250 RepID=UPI002490439E|nr:aldehyde dehydrogenase [Paenibacillus sp. YYML68]